MIVQLRLSIFIQKIVHTEDDGLEELSSHRRLQASNHTGKISQEIKRTKQVKGMRDKSWSLMSSEETANEIDEEDNQRSGSQINTDSMEDHI